MTIATIDMVAGDNLPCVALALTDSSTGSTIDVSNPLTTVVVLFRTPGATGGVPLPCTNVDSGADGRVQFDFPSGVSNVPAGLYEGQIVVTFWNGNVQTVYDKLKFRIRAA
jgi:hypothetical protein